MNERTVVPMAKVRNMQVKFPTLRTQTESAAAASSSIELTTTAGTLKFRVFESIAYEERADLTRLLLTGGRRIEAKGRIAEIEPLVAAHHMS
jgi:hypothetical protein